jgi:hypothetical protein
MNFKQNCTPVKIGFRTIFKIRGINGRISVVKTQCEDAIGGHHLSEVSQVQKDKDCMFSLMYER